MAHIPYEFCTQSEYEKLKSNNSLYFLYIGVDKESAFSSWKRVEWKMRKTTSSARLN